MNNNNNNNNNNKILLLFALSILPSYIFFEFHIVSQSSMLNNFAKKMDLPISWLDHGNLGMSRTLSRPITSMRKRETFTQEMRSLLDKKNFQRQWVFLHSQIGHA